MSSPLRIGLIGVGGIGQEHLRCIDHLEHDKQVKLMAVTEPAVESLAEVRDALTRRGVQWHADYLEMLQKGPALDAVVIAAPIPFHAEMTQACMEKGLFVLLEKPPVPLLRDFEKLLGNKMESRVAVGFQMICSPEIRRLKQWIGDGFLGEIGEIRVMACWPRSDRYYQRASWAGKMTLGDRPVFDGPSTNALAHLIHNVMFLAGDKFAGFGEPTEIRGELYRARPIQSHDVASLQGRFGSGASFLVSVAHAVQETQPIQIEVRGSRGWARISHEEPPKRAPQLESHEGPCTDLDLESGDIFLNMYRDFVEFAEGKRVSPATRLSDTRGYLLAANGALIASGGIHSIAPAFVRRYGSGLDGGYFVEGLLESVQRSFQSGRPFSELDIPWAVRSNFISQEDVEKTNLTIADLKKWSLPAAANAVAQESPA
jgi:predicted dehydrogenase